MQKVNMIRALTVPVATAFALAACAPQMATMAPVKSESAAVNPAAQPAAQVPAAGTVSGLVKSYNADSQKFEAVAGATVKLDGTTLVATTDAEGRYQLRGVPAGAQNLTVTKAGFTAGSGRLVANTVMGLAGVNVALSRASYGLKQTPMSAQARNIQVYGVVSDPRGVALPNAKVTVTTTSGAVQSGPGIVIGTNVATSTATTAGSIVADAAGYYAFPVVGAMGDAQVNLQAAGETAGKLPVEMAAPYEPPVDASVVADGVSLLPANLQCDKFLDAGKPTFSGLMMPGEEVEIKVLSGLSARADEFFIRIEQREGDDVKTLDVLPKMVESTNNTGKVKFIVPQLIQDSGGAGGPTSISIMQLGLKPGTSSASVTAWAYSAANYKADVGVAQLALMQADINPDLFFAGDDVKATFKLKNGGTNTPVTVDLSFSLPASATVKTEGATFDGPGLTLTSGSNLLEGAVAAGRKTWTIKGLPLPKDSGSGKDLVLNLGTATGQSLVNIADIKLTYPTRNFVVDGDKMATVTAGVQDLAGYTVTKKVTKGGDSDAHDIELTLTASGTLLSALRMVDITPFASGGLIDEPELTLTGVGLGAKQGTGGSVSWTLRKLSQQVVLADLPATLTAADSIATTATSLIAGFELVPPTASGASTDRNKLTITYRVAKKIGTGSLALSTTGAGGQLRFIARSFVQGLSPFFATFSDVNPVASKTLTLAE